MSGSLYNGASGLLSFQNALNVESNNAANVNTVAFKADTVSFADLIYQDGIGKGVTFNDPSKDFSQGNITQTGVEFDFAINGEGFFTVQSPQNDAIYYTRAGNFRSDIDLNLVDSTGNYVLGVLPVVTGDEITSEFSNFLAGAVIEDNTSITSTNSFATDYRQTVGPSGTTGNDFKTTNNNLSDIEALRTAYINAIAAHERSPSEGEVSSIHIDEITYPTAVTGSGGYSVEVTINGVKFQENFDTDVATTLNNLSDNINTTAGITSRVDTTTGVLTIESLIAGEDITTSNAIANDSRINIDNISLESGSGQNLVDSIFLQLQTLVEANGGKVATVETKITKTLSGEVPIADRISLDLNTLGISTVVDQNGNSITQISEFENDNGNLYLTQNGARYLVGKLDTVVFNENRALNPEGNNLYSSNTESGEARFIEGKAEILNNSLELSSSDLSETLVNLIIWQRAFEANAKSVTTSDELLKTALALKNQ